jgi:hypothetical protein
MVVLAEHLSALVVLILVLEQMHPLSRYLEDFLLSLRGMTRVFGFDPMFFMPNPMLPFDSFISSLGDSVHLCVIENSCDPACSVASLSRIRIVSISGLRIGTHAQHSVMDPHPSKIRSQRRA